MKIAERPEFDRRRNCSRCGQRLMYTQLEVALVQRMTKRCPNYRLGVVVDAELHDFLEHDHEYPYRDRNGHLSRGSRRVVRERLA